jgi:FG-GAP repeat protein
VEGCGRNGVRVLVLLSLLVSRGAIAQGAYEIVRGTAGVEHAGLGVAGSGRLGTAAADSAWSIVLGPSGTWTIRPGLRAVSLATPAGASWAFGSSAAIGQNFASASFDALVVGDPGFAQARGRVSIYLGGPGFTSTPSLTIEGESPGDLFGGSVADIGDIDADGFGDLAVGALGYASGTGRVYVFLGGALPSTSPAFTLDGASSGDLSGSAIAGIGDLDQDGRADFVVGAPGVAAGQGALSIFHGSASASPPIQTIPFPGPTPRYGERPRFGSVLTGGRDLDGDGQPDFVAGAPGAGGGRGSAFVFHGTAGTIDPAGQAILGLAAHDQFGSSLVLGPLIDGTVTDLAVGSPGANEGHGAASVFGGGGAFDLQPDAAVSGERVDDNFGWSLGAGRLFTTAPAAQLLIGAPLADNGAENGGVGYFFAVPPAVAVQELPLIVEADGALLKPNAYTSTSPVLRLQIPGSASIDTVSAEILLDGRRLALSGVIGESTAPGDGILLRLRDLSEGLHRLQARVLDGGHSRAGTADLAFQAAARLRIDAPRVFPNPARDFARLLFSLTRPASYNLRLFDVTGRRVYESGPTEGVPAENETHLGKDADGRSLPGGVYFYVLRANYQEQRSSAKGRVVLVR